jgi:hypothetical protein
MRTKYIVQTAAVGWPKGAWCVRCDSIDIVRTIAICPTKEDAELIADNLNQAVLEG